MLGRVLTVVSITAAILLLVPLQITAPATVGPLGILIVFILMYLSALGVLTFFLYEGSRLIAKNSRNITVRKPLQPLTLHRAYYYSTVVALAPVMLIGMQSVGGVGVYELGLIVIFVVIACIYISKRSQ